MARSLGRREHAWSHLASGAPRRRSARVSSCAGRWVALAALLALGCEFTIPSGRFACTTNADCPPGLTCALDRCVREPSDAGLDGQALPDACLSCDDDNDTFASADPIAPGAGVAGVIDPAGDVDYYTFEGRAGEWVEIATIANPDSPPGDPALLDTIITLYDASHRQIAESDDGFPRVSPDSDLITLIPADGTYYVLLQDWRTSSGMEGVGMPSFTYTLEVEELQTSARVNVDAETGDTAGEAQALTAQTVEGGQESLILGTFDDETDVDVYSFTVAEESVYTVNIIPSGEGGDGASTSPARVWISDVNLVYASVSPPAYEPLAAGQNVVLAPSLRAGSYFLNVQADGGDFYVLKASSQAELPTEMMETTNGVANTAEPLTVVPNPAEPAFGWGSVLAHLPDGDTDYYSFMPAGDVTLEVSCASRSEGSGVMGLRVALLASDTTTELASVEEQAPEAAVLRHDVSAGTYFLRLTKASQDPEVTGDWVRCRLYVVASP